MPAGTTLTLIPEEFGGGKIPLRALVDTLVGAIIKRAADGRRDGVAVIAEGVALGIDPDDLGRLADVERDAHGHLRIAEINIGEILKDEVQKTSRAEAEAIQDIVANLMDLQETATA